MEIIRSMMPSYTFSLSGSNTTPRPRSGIVFYFLVFLLAAACHGPQHRQGDRILTTIGQIAALSPSQYGYPVRLQATVTYYDPKNNLLFVQDETKGMLIDDAGQNLGLKAGQMVEITGTAAEGGSGVASPQFKVLGQAPMPTPTVISVNQLRSSADSSERVEIQGVVHSAFEQDNSLVLKVACGSHTVIRAEILDFHYIPDPTTLVDSTVTVRGVCRRVSGRDASTGSFQILVPSFDQVAVQEPAPADPFAIAPRAVAELAVASAVEVPTHRVRIQGAVVKQKLGEFLVINDGKHEVRLDTLQMTPVRLGDRIDAIGFLAAAGSATALEDASFRPASSISPIAPKHPSPHIRKLSPSSVLTTVRQVRSLTPDQARQAYAVRINAVVTFYDSRAFLMFVQDSTGGIFVNCNPSHFQVSPGEFVRVEGVTNPGDFAPYIERTRVHFLKEASMPAPEQPSMERLVSGEQDSQWIELRGIVRSATKRGADIYLEMFGDIGPFQVQIPSMPDSAVPIRLVDAEVRIRGACGTRFNDKRQFLGVRLFAPGLDYITIEKPGPEDPFSAVAQPIADLLQFSSEGISSHRVEVNGLVTLHRPGQGLFVLDETGGVYVETQQKTPVSPGDVVQVVGFPAHGEYSPILKEGIFKKIGTGNAPAAKDVAPEDILGGRYDAQPVRIKATLIDVNATTAERVLTLQSGRFTFNALLEGTEKEDSLGALRSGSLLQLAGLCSIQADTTANPVVPRSFRIFIASPADITVLESAPWWTLKHTIWAITGLSLVICFSLAWVGTLRRRMAAQTIVITQHLEREASLRLENQLRRAQKMESIGTLAGGIAHDFNNILGAILGYCELAMSDLGDRKAAQGYLAEVLVAGGRAKELIRQILTFSRQQESERKPIRLQPVLQEALSLLRAGLPSTIEIRQQIDSEAPPMLGDQTQIHQVMMNLGTNALHAMSERNGILEVSLSPFEVDADLARMYTDLHQGRYLRLTVSDTGQGMDRETMERIFEPFFTTKAVGEGTGLGLSLVHGIVKNHEGSISVYSEPGKGTTFNLYFPVYGGNGDAVALASDPIPRGGGERILFVDDEESLTQLGKEILDRLGYQVTARTSSSDALETFKEAPHLFDLVITDYTMPGMNGIDLAETLLQIRADLPVILTTGYSSPVTAEKAQSLGVRELLLKPNTVRSLGGAAHRVLAKVRGE